jgi:hypothetical protein
VVSFGEREADPPLFSRSPHFARRDGSVDRFGKHESIFNRFFDSRVALEK